MMALFPKRLRYLHCIDFQVLPPAGLVAGLMKLAMMATTEWDGEFIADL
jgi:hypothetical protein